MLGRIFAIALNTFRESVRKRILIAIIVLVIAGNLFAIVLGEMSLHEEARVARDVGLGAISFFGGITALILGALLLYTEIQRRTIHTIICKPIERHEFVLGKYLGMTMVLTILVVLFTLAMAGLLALQGVPLSAAVAKAVVLSYVEVLVVAAIAVFFSSFSSPVLSGMFTGMIWMIGRVTPFLIELSERSDFLWIRGLTGFARYAVPNLHLYAVSGGTVDGQYVSVHRDFVTWGYVGVAGGYGVAYIVLLLVLAVLIFRQRDFA
jgi:ABC-type transport system involved in multi-copper enzyme maturation permease subunit